MVALGVGGVGEEDRGDAVAEADDRGDAGRLHLGDRVRALGLQCRQIDRVRDTAGKRVSARLELRRHDVTGRRVVRILRVDDPEDAWARNHRVCTAAGGCQRLGRAGANARRAMATNSLSRVW